MTENIYINRLNAWAPGVGSAGEWDEWAAGKRDIALTGKSPELSFADPMFRRRLSQLCKMTIQVTHDLKPVLEDTKIFFFSFRGEISRQFQINKMLIEENTLSPALFSLSVFNAAAAQATMALGIKGGYCAIYPQDNSFVTGLTTACASLLGSSAKEAVFIYADEEVPAEYACFFKEEAPCAISFGLLLSKKPDEKSVVLNVPEKEQKPASFLKNLLNGGELHVSS